MGLDIVGIIMELEDEFGVAIDDGDLAEVRTVGQLYEVLLAKLGAVPDDEVCMSSRVFYRLRRGLQEATGAARGDITPATALQDLLPIARRRDAWRAWALRSGLKLPDLTLPPPFGGLAQAAVAVAMAALTAALAWTLSSYGASWTWAVWGALMLWPLTLFASWMVVQLATRRWAVVFPTHARTVGDLTRELVRRGVPASAPKARQLMTPETVWNRVADVIHRQASIQRELITPGATFRDLQL